jgi:hypothetical protein
MSCNCCNLVELLKTNMHSEFTVFELHTTFSLNTTVAPEGTITSTVYGEWPYMCAIFLTNGAEQTFLAGASLIAPGVALSVAHWLQ